MQEPSSRAELEVLLIEDNPADARLVQTLLAAADAIAVTWAATLDDGLRQLRAGRFDAVLLDLLLPDARGVDLVATLRAADPAVAIVVASGQAVDDALLLRAVIRQGAEELLCKGELTTARLECALWAAVERGRRRHQAGTRTAALAAALAEARIGHWSWSAGDRTVELAGHFPGPVAGAASLPAGTLVPARRLLRWLPRWAWRCLLAARRPGSTDADRLALVVVEGGPETAGSGGDLILEAAVERDADGRVRRLQGTVREAAGAAAVERLEGEMITHLGHELRTPLTTIRAALGLLASAEAALPPASSRILVANAVANADRIGQVIAATLQPGAPCAVLPSREPPLPGGLRLQPRSVSLGPFLYDALAVLLPTLTGAGISLVLAPAARTMEVRVDAGRLRRAVDYLCRRLVADHAAPAAAGTGRRRFVLDVTADGAVAWLWVADAAAIAAEAWPTEPGAGPEADGSAAGRRSASAGDASSRSSGSAWRFAVALGA